MSLLLKLSVDADHFERNPAVSGQYSPLPMQMQTDFAHPQAGFVLLMLDSVRPAWLLVAYCLNPGFDVTRHNPRSKGIVADFAC
jgi:hypothetical protein